MGRRDLWVLNNSPKIIEQVVKLELKARQPDIRLNVCLHAALPLRADLWSPTVKMCPSCFLSKENVLFFFLSLEKQIQFYNVSLIEMC